MIFRSTLFFAFILLGQISAFNSLDSLISRGISYSYNFEFEKADSTFQIVIEKFPEDPRGYFYLSQNHLWFYLGSRDKGELVTFSTFTDLAFEKLEQIEDSLEDNPVFIELEANLYLQKAMVAGAEESTLDAFFATKSAYSRYEDILEIDSTFSRAYLGLGLLEYALSYVPGFFRWALTIAGLGSDKEKGFELVSNALKYVKTENEITEINYHYSKMLLEFIGDREGAIKILEALTAKFPNNLLFQYQLALAYIENRDIEAAKPVLNKVKHSSDKRFISTIAFAHFLLGEIEFRSENYSDSRMHYDEFLTLSRGYEYSGMAYFNIALSYLFEDNEIEARKNLLLARNGNSDISDDLYAKRRSEVIFDLLPDDKFLYVVKARNYLYLAQYDEAINFINEIIIDLTGEDLIEANLILAESLLLTNNIETAGKVLSRIDISHIEYEEWLEPYFYFLKSWESLKKTNYENFERYVKEATSSNIYDFKEKITTKINYIEFIHSKL
jgi:tetratricopeptide (TPR) repeat protein